MIAPFLEGSEIDWDVSACHPAYEKFTHVWDKTRDAREGSESIKRGDSQEEIDRAQRYLPKLSGHKKLEEYMEYRDRAIWYGATGRTVDAYIGMIFRKDPVYSYKTADGQDLAPDDVVSEKLNTILQTTTPDGRSFDDLAREALDEVFTVNRVGLLEDYPSMLQFDGSIRVMTQLEFEKQGISSKTTIYRASSIINWKTELIDNDIVPVFFVLKERYLQTDAKNPLVFTKSYKYRILYLTWGSEGIEYQQALVAPSGKDTKKYTVEKVVRPLKQGKALDRIPFWILTSDGLLYDRIQVPLINDLAEMNIGHYRNSADYEGELHKLAVKTACFPGWNTEELGDPTLGGALKVPVDSEPFFLEASSNSGIKEEMAQKENRMAALGAELLSNTGRYMQAAETVRLQSSGEASVIQGIVKLTSDILSKILTFKLEWSGNQLQGEITLNDDMVETELTAEQLTGMIQHIQAGLMSYKTYFFNMQKQDLYPPGWNEEKELAEIQKDRENQVGAGSEMFNELANQVAEMKATMEKPEEPEVPEGTPAE